MQLASFGPDSAEAAEPEEPEEETRRRRPVAERRRALL